ncbi:MAG: hypothetical protein IJP64_07895 [Oscillospiraceae bacterium]|nr:hypothetical protein [Oscillospiraceae bacterium]
MAAEKQNLQQIQEAHAELYDSEAALFDGISLHEDTSGKRRFLLEHFSFDGKSVLEAGAGPGSIFWAMPVSEMTVCGFLLLFMRKKQFSDTGEEQHYGR